MLLLGSAGDRPQAVPAPVQVATLTVPGSFVGMSAATVPAPEFDQLHLVYSVDPQTGALPAY